MKINETQDIQIDGSKLRIAIVVPYFNEDLGLQLLKNCLEELELNKVASANTYIVRVFGSLEIPFACKKIIEKTKPDVIITLGVVIRGQTSHYELVTNNTYKGLMDLQLAHDIPIIFGTVAAENIEQAQERIDKNRLNKGKDAAQAALLQTLI